MLGHIAKVIPNILHRSNFYTVAVDVALREVLSVTATQSIEALAQYKATMQACTIGSLWTRISS